MKPIVYFFGILPEGFASYPQDHTSAFFKDFLKKSKNTVQIVVHRKDNLLYYGYVRKLNDRHYFGACVCINRIYSNIDHLFRIFDDVYTQMLEKGEILRLDSKACVEWAAKSYASESVAINEYTRQITDAIDISAESTQELPPADFSISIFDCKEISLEASTAGQIVEATKRYANLYITKTDAEIEKVSAFISLIKAKNLEIERLKKDIKGNPKKSKIKRRLLTGAVCMLCLWAAVAGISEWQKTPSNSKIHSEAEEQEHQKADQSNDFVSQGKNQSSQESPVTEDFLRVSPESFNIGYEGGSQAFTVSSNTPWEIVIEPAQWGRIENKTSSGFTLVCERNNSRSPRNDYMEVMTGSERFRINISQEANSGPTASITSIDQEHNVYQGERKGMRIKLKFDVSGMKDRRIEAIAWFYHSDNVTLLKRADGNGQVRTSKTDTAPYEDTTFNMTLFLPYSSLNMPNGFDGELSFDIVIQDASGNALTRNDNNRFTFTT